MKRILLAGLVIFSLYGGVYGLLRCNNSLVRHISYKPWLGPDWIVANSEIVERIFQPAWIAERKSRSLYWRIKNRKALSGHVYY